ncbi:hypothetical protein [Microbacterium sp. B19]|uniref:hypothetical protein n=1 Tax=Microbacterium sp. B19 TaxID=96765 RepID=UPI0003B37A03|nr:hypothetical protein [Microbacterium sp. B19]
MKATIVRSLATIAIVAGAVFAVPSGAIASTAESPEDAPAHAAVSTTGGGAPVLGFWIGGGTLALIGGAVAVGTTVRRHRRDLDV